MKTPTPASKDNVMMSTLLITGLLMVFAVPALNAQQHRVDRAAAMVVESAQSVARSLGEPAALRFSEPHEAAIIASVTAPVKEIRKSRVPHGRFI